MTWGTMGVIRWTNGDNSEHKVQRKWLGSRGNPESEKVRRWVEEDRVILQMRGTCVEVRIAQQGKHCRQKEKITL